MSSGGDRIASMIAAMISDIRVLRLSEEWCDPTACGPEEGLCPGGDPVVRWAHHRQLELCDKLELLADSLPANVDRMTCLYVANTLVPSLRDIHRYEEQVVFPAYEAIAGIGSRESTIRRLRMEHLEDECFADEVTEVLLAIGHGRPIANAEATGFMLRGLFETMRRHVAFEREHVMPMLDRKCGPLPG